MADIHAENVKLHGVLDEIAKIVELKFVRNEKTGQYELDPNDWYALHCLTAFAPEPVRRRPGDAR